MKKIVVTALVAAFLPLSAFADKCMNSASSQGQMNGCAQQLHKTADKQLNKTYHDAITRVTNDVEGKKRLVVAQRTWIAFRDAECDFVASGVGEGSAGRMVRLGCLEELTTKRVAQLQKYLDCPEGDLSCPLPRAN